MALKDILRDQDEMKAHEYQFVLWTRKWQEFDSMYQWNIFKLDSNEKRKIPNQSGIYTLLVQPGIANHPACSYLMYVGKTISLRRRFGDYLNEKKRETGRPKIMRLLNKYAGYVHFCYTIVPEKKLTSVEESLISAYIPPANDRFPAEITRVIGAYR